jgi:hypothetical protein
MQGDLDELGLDVGPRVAIANYLQTAKNKFKGTIFLFTHTTHTHNTQHAFIVADVGLYLVRPVGESGSIKATIESQDLVFHKKLGEGNFGDVWQGKLRGTTTVAIKTIRSEDKSAFLLEAHIMAYPFPPPPPAATHHPSCVSHWCLSNVGNSRRTPTS